MEIAELQTKAADSNGGAPQVEPDRPPPQPRRRLDLAESASRRRAAAARREELVLQRAVRFSTFLELQEWRADVAAECNAAVWTYRKQAAARSKDRASAAELGRFRRLALITNGHVRMTRLPITSDRPGPVEDPAAAATSVIGLAPSSGGGRD